MSEIESTSTNAVLDNVRIVLINTGHPGNIGAAARAIKNMGLSRLYLVAPQNYPHQKATWRAASATDILDNVVVCETLEEAVGDCHLVVGTSARDRSIPWPLMSARECAETVAKEAALRGEEQGQERQQVAILFGREDRGLTNDELKRCHFHLQIPANPEYSALNIAAAVQVVCYELRQAALAGEELDEAWDWGVEWDIRSATAEEMQFFFKHLEETLIDLDFLDPKSPRQLMTRLTRLFMRSRPDDFELSILRGVLTAAQKAAKSAR